MSFNTAWSAVRLSLHQKQSAFVEFTPHLRQIAPFLTPLSILLHDSPQIKSHRNRVILPGAVIPYVDGCSRYKSAGDAAQAGSHKVVLTHMCLVINVSPDRDCPGSHEVGLTRKSHVTSRQPQISTLPLVTRMVLRGRVPLHVVSPVTMSVLVATKPALGGRVPFLSVMVVTKSALRGRVPFLSVMIVTKSALRGRVPLRVASPVTFSVPVVDEVCLTRFLLQVASNISREGWWIWRRD